MALWLACNLMPQYVYTVQLICKLIQIPPPIPQQLECTCMFSKYGNLIISYILSTACFPVTLCNEMDYPTAQVDRTGSFGL